MLLIFVLTHNAVYSQSESEIIKKAEELFEEEDYKEAYKHYSQLVANKPTDALYNYRLGVCMIYSEPNKKKCFNYLNKAFNNRKELPKDVAFFVGKAYHINYQFDEAIKFYNVFKSEAPSSLQKKLKVDNEIKACGNGKRLLSTMTDLVVITKKNLNEKDYFRSYTPNEFRGKLLVLPDKFKTNYDKKKKTNSIMFLSDGGGRVYFSSYGNKDINGKDIYYADRLPNGEFDKPQLVEGINTEYDEDYPFIDPSGKKFYFSSKGHNSMGGYDIFVSEFNVSTGTWGTPRNLEFPINSPDDDYLFVTDTSGKYAYFSTGRYSEPSKIDVLKIKTERKPIDQIVMKASVAKETAKQSVKSKVTIKNISTEQDIGVFYADDDGRLNMTLPNGAKLLYTVETPDLKTQSQGINLPLARVGKPFSQTITYQNGILKIINNFEEAPSDDSYLQYLKLIEEKAKLDPNEGKNNLSVDTSTETPLATNDKNTDAVNTNNPTIVDNNNSDKGNEGNQSESQSKYEKYDYSSKEHKLIVQKDATKAKKEADDFFDDSSDADELAKSLIIKTKNNEAKINELQSKIEASDNQEDKDKWSKEISALQNKNTINKTNSDQLIAISDALKADAKNKEKEFALNNQLAAELSKRDKSKKVNPETQKNIDNLKEQLIALSKTESASKEVFAAIQNSIDDKEKNYQAIAKESNQLNKELEDLNKEISNTENELAAAKKKKKPEIQSKLDELNNEKNNLVQTIEKTKKQENEAYIALTAAKNQQENAQKIKNESIAKTNVEADNTKEPETSSKSLETKYSGVLTTSESGNKDALLKAIEANKKYNTEIDNLIANNNKRISTEKNQTIKSDLQQENKNLEALKKQNTQTIANYTDKVNALEKQSEANIAGNNTQKTGLKPIEITDSKNAVKEIEDVKLNLNQQDNSLFTYNNYNNSNGQNLKLKADQQINEVYAEQNKLKELIGESIAKIENSKQNNVGNIASPEKLLEESDKLYEKAGDLRKSAEGKNPDEKAKLLSEADDLETQAEKKQIEASEASAQISNDKFSINNENIQALLANGKGLDTEKENAKNLMAEAETAMKQAKSIREEANSFVNTAAKIGNLGNAEEKELIAISKQNQAIEILKNANANVPLKKYEPGTSKGASEENPEIVKNEIVKINEAIDKLITNKTTAYQTLASANKEEINSQKKELENKLSSNDSNIQTKANEASALENEIASLENDIQSTSNKSDKLTKSNDLLVKQNQLLTIYEEIKKMPEEQPLVSDNNQDNKQGNEGEIKGTENNNPENKTGDNKTEGNNVQENNTGDNNSKGNDNAVANNSSKTPTTTPIENKTEQPEDSSNVATTSKTIAPSNTLTTNFSVDIDLNNNTDTSIAQINKFFTENNFELSNSNANDLKNSAISNLQQINSEQQALESEIKNLPIEGTSTLSNKQIEGKIDNLLTASDNLYAESTKLRNEAETKKGNEKDELLKQADEIDKKAFEKKVEASLLTQQFNEANYIANKKAIQDLIELHKASNPGETGKYTDAVTEISNSKTQAKNIREEADALTNNYAKLGAIGNAEEIEANILYKQQQLIEELKKSHASYVVNEPSYTNISGDKQLPENILAKKKDLEERQITELTKLANAYNLEFETNKNNIPENPPADKAKDFDKIYELNNQSKTMLVKSTQANSTQEKLKLLSVAAKSGHAAAYNINSLTKGSTPQIASNKTGDNKSNDNTDDKSNNTNKNNNTSNNKNNNANNLASNNKNNTNKNNNKSNNNTNKTNATNANNKDVLVSVEGLQVLKKDAYSEANPIPIDAKMPDGLIFRVQIGAFKSKIDQNAFKGLTPINGETAQNGYTRYTAGNFNEIENASAVKSDLNKNGYPDAFVVAFLNGKRVTIAEAIEYLKSQGKTVDIASNKSAGITTNVSEGNAKTNPEAPVIVSKELEKTKNLLYTVQIGVYSRKISQARLKNLSPIFSEQLPNGLYRYTAGIYNGTEKLISDKNRVIDLGIKDAFVSAYLEGKRIPFNEAKTRKDSDATIQFEPENPIVFPQGEAPAPNTNISEQTPPPSSTVTPYSNGVKDKPVATPENGVKEVEEGITFKVQIGAYSRQVPTNVAGVFDKITNWPVEFKYINGLFIYNVGSFVEAKFAKSLKDEMIALGITDAFVVVYKDGVKLFGSQAAEYLNR